MQVAVAAVVAVVAVVGVVVKVGWTVLPLFMNRVSTEQELMSTNTLNFPSQQFLLLAY